jgi:hypothetical protein
MNEKLILGAKDIEGVLTKEDGAFLETLHGMYDKVKAVFPELDEGNTILPSRMWSRATRIWGTP